MRPQFSADAYTRNNPLCPSPFHPPTAKRELMKMDRNRYFLIGMLLILIGIQFRMVESVVLNEQTTRALARVTNTKAVANSDMMSSLLMQVYPAPKKRIVPPRWIGLAMIAIGAVVSLHAIAIPRRN